MFRFLILPSESILKKKRQKLSVHEDYCPTIYSTFTMRLFKKKTNRPIDLNNEKVIGHLMCDKMKLKDKIFWNCQSNKMVGFTCGGNSLD